MASISCSRGCSTKMANWFASNTREKLGAGGNARRRDEPGTPLGEDPSHPLPPDSNSVAPSEGEYNQAAYHGSPYRFDKFSLDHMGRGEGAQAYGWGLYFAGNKEVAEWYRKSLSDASDTQTVLVNGEKVDNFSPEGHAARTARRASPLP